MIRLRHLASVRSRLTRIGCAASLSAAAPLVHRQGRYPAGATRAAKGGTLVRFFPAAPAPSLPDDTSAPLGKRPVSTYAHRLRRCAECACPSRASAMPIPCRGDARRQGRHAGSILSSSTIFCAFLLQCAAQVLAEFFELLSPSVFLRQCQCHAVTCEPCAAQFNRLSGGIHVQTITAQKRVAFGDAQVQGLGRGGQRRSQP